MSWENNEHTPRSGAARKKPRKALKFGVSSLPGVPGRAAAEGAPGRGAQVPQSCPEVKGRAVSGVRSLRHSRHL